MSNHDSMNQDSMNENTSQVHGFYKKSHSRRLEIIKNFSSLSDKEVELLKNFNSIDFGTANRMVENVLSVMPIPLGVAANFLINKKEYFIPMATEESSVIAAASYAAKLARPSGGFTAKASSPIMIGQIQLKKISNLDEAIQVVEKNKTELLNLANTCDDVLIEVGGGATDLFCKPFFTSRGKMLLVHILVDVRDAMGANIVNRMAEHITPLLEKISGGTVGIRIVSNLSVNRMVESEATWKKADLGEQLIEDILDAYELALVDPFRCATHNKGIMNGIDAVAIATGNDFRAIEAGAHAFATIDNNGSYKPLTSYHKNDVGDLVGKIRIPLAAGIVGGIIRSHPIAQICIKILGLTSASELAEVMGSVGLAQNFAALRALASEGILRGHMRLHSKNIAIAAGAPKELIDKIAHQMISEDNISVGYARELIKLWLSE